MNLITLRNTTAVGNIVNIQADRVEYKDAIVIKLDQNGMRIRTKMFDKLREFEIPLKEIENITRKQ